MPDNVKRRSSYGVASKEIDPTFLLGPRFRGNKEFAVLADSKIQFYALCKGRDNMRTAIDSQRFWRAR